MMALIMWQGSLACIRNLAPAGSVVSEMMSENVDRYCQLCTEIPTLQ